MFQCFQVGFSSALSNFLTCLLCCVPQLLYRSLMCSLFTSLFSSAMSYELQLPGSSWTLSLLTSTWRAYQVPPDFFLLATLPNTSLKTVTVVITDFALFISCLSEITPLFLDVQCLKNYIQYFIQVFVCFQAVMINLFFLTLCWPEQKFISFSYCLVLCSRNSIVCFSKSIFQLNSKNYRGKQNISCIIYS